MYNSLFSPIKLGKIELKNRVVFTSIGINSYNSDGTVTDENISFVKARSIETGMILTTVSMATFKYGKVKFIGSYDDIFIPTLAKLADAGHYGGAKILLQISAMGGPNTLVDDEFKDITPFVPSLNVPEYTHEWKGRHSPVELQTEQIEEIIDDFIKASIRAKEAGFDGVELFAAEDFLLSSFITPHFNKRTDKYGGNFENMMRVPVEIIQGIRKKCGEDFLIGFKYNTFYEFPEGDGINFDLGVKIGKRIAQEKVSYLHAYSYAKNNKPFSLFKYSIMASQYQPRNTTIPISKNLKDNISNIPIMAVGSILKPNEADGIIRRGCADLVSIGRAFIADPLWAYKAKHNLAIRPCIRCFVCLHEATRGRIISCSVNPDVIADKSNKLIKTSMPKKVMVVGAGPAGITAALTASERGHYVSLYEKEADVGGKLVVSTIGSLKFEYADLLQYYRYQLKKSKVKVFTNTEITKSDIIKNNPDILIIAIGAGNASFELTKLNSTTVLNVSDAILNSNSFHNKRIIIIGGNTAGCEAAAILQRKGNFVIIIEENDSLMYENKIEYLTMVLEKILIEEDVRFLLNFRLLNVDNNKVYLENIKNNNSIIIRSDVVINALEDNRPVKQIKELLSTCKTSFVIGDCAKRGRILQAVKGAFKISRSI